MMWPDFMSTGLVIVTFGIVIVSGCVESRALSGSPLCSKRLLNHSDSELQCNTFVTSQITMLLTAIPE